MRRKSIKKRVSLCVIIPICIVAIIIICNNYLWSTKLVNAIEKNDSRTVSYMIKNKGMHNVNFPGGGMPFIINAEFWATTPLQSGCEKGNYSIIKLLLEGGADPNKSTLGNYSPLILILYFADENDLRTVKLLVRYGVDLDKVSAFNDRSPILYVADSSPYVTENGDISTYSDDSAKNITRLYDYMVRHIINKEPIDHKTGENALLLASRMTNLSLVKYIINEQKIGINSVDNDGRSALFIEPYDKNDSNDKSIEMTRLLLKFGIDENIKDNNGETAYDYAVKNGNKYSIIKKAMEGKQH